MEGSTNMSVQRLTPKDFGVLENPGVVSVQMVWGQNAPESKVTVTRVTMQQGATSSRHTHENSEQTWLVERGEATLLLANNETAPLRAGDVIRTPAGTVHGVENSGPDEFTYLAITTPPQDFLAAYERQRDV